jgi:hypothetical protein
VLWLRPAFQSTHSTATRTEITDEEVASVPPAVPIKRVPWPANLPEQIRLVAETVAASAHPLDLDQLAACFTGRGPWKRRLPEIVSSLEALGRVQVQSRDGRMQLHG